MDTIFAVVLLTCVSGETPPCYARTVNYAHTLPLCEEKGKAIRSQVQQNMVIDGVDGAVFSQCVRFNNIKSH